MPKVTVVRGAAAALIVLVLTGCAQAPSSASSVTDEPPAASAEQTPEPLAVTPSESSAPADSPEAKFLDRVKVGLVDTPLGEATDEQLLAAGNDACAQLADGVPYKDVLVVEGDEKIEDDWYRYSSAFTVVGGTILCPDVYPPDAPRI